MCCQSICQCFSERLPAAQQARADRRSVHVQFVRNLRGRLAQVIEPVKDLPVLLRQRRKRLCERLAALLFDHLLPEPVERDERIVLQRKIDVLPAHGLRRPVPRHRAEPWPQLSALDARRAVPEREKHV